MICITIQNLYYNFQTNLHVHIKIYNIYSKLLPDTLLNTEKWYKSYNVIIMRKQRRSF